VRLIPALASDGNRDARAPLACFVLRARREQEGACMRLRHARTPAALFVSPLLLVAAAGCSAPVQSPLVAESSSALGAATGVRPLVSAATGVRPLVTVLMALPGPIAPASQQWTNKSQSPNAGIPDNWTYGVSSDLTIDAAGGSCSGMKSIQLDLGITHPRLADLYISASMVSPDGSSVYKTQTIFDGPTNGRNGMTQAQMQQALAGDQDISMLTYASGCGRLRVNVADWAPGSTGTLNSFTVKVRTAWFPFAHDNAYYTNLIFGPNGPNVNGFFQEESRGAFQFSNAGVYGILPWGNWHVGETDEQHVDDIIAWLDALNFPFAQYDTNHNGTVESNELQIVQFENSGDVGGANRWGCTHANRAGVDVCLSAALVSEQTDFETLAHEISHTLGTVDLYGAWSKECYSYGMTLMSCTISWDDNPATVYHDPWHRSHLGWLTPYQSGCTSYRLGDETNRTSPAIYRNPSNANEYYLFEYRRPNGYDANVSDSGIVAWHVSENADGSPYKGPNGDQPEGHAIYALSPDAKNGQKVGGSRAWKPTDNPFQLKWLDGSAVGYTFSMTSNGASNGMTLDCVDPSRFNFSMPTTTPPIAANGSDGVPITTNIGSCSPVQYSVTAGMNGVTAWVDTPSVSSSGTTWLSLEVPYTTAPESGTVTVTGTCGGMAESQTVQVTTTACVPTGCSSDSCGLISNGCGGKVSCGGCADGLTCQYGTCQPPPTCHTPMQCCLQNDGCSWRNGRCICI
jgi:M6 family metalloprotease-like protein